MQEGPQTVGLTAIDAIAALSEHIRIGFFDVADKDVQIGNTRIGRLPNLPDDTFAADLSIIKLISIAPVAIGVYIIAV